MGGSRRKLKRSRAKVKVGLPRKKPREFKPAFDLPEALAAAAAAAEGGGHAPSWDSEGSVVKNYAAFGVVANPNLLGAHARGTPRLVQSAQLQAPDIDAARAPVDEFEPVDSGSDLESDDLKSALGKQRRDGKSAPLEPLTKVQRIYIGRLIEKHADDYKAMFMDIKLNTMQHSVGTLKKLCERYHVVGKSIIHPL
uniref:Nucleolar protein 16 n=1 Tax=Oryza punctata TaxID=4537 RepID=A0A0E0L1N3_ORYPU